jgi:hypothetical protein
MQVLTDDQYRMLAEFRRQLRVFLDFSARAAMAHGLQSQQHQLLLAIRGVPQGVRPCSWRTTPPASWWTGW